MRSTGKPVTPLAAGLCPPTLKCFSIRSLPLLLALLLPLTAWPQSADIAGKDKQDETADNSENSSRQVEESEEAYRRRMETEIARDQSRVILDRSNTPLKPAEGIAALPYESQKHLRDEMRDVIIEQEEWKPEDANTIYPYSPSAAAEKDPELRQKEEAAWGDLVREYHKREAAALAAGGARSGFGPEQGQGGGKNGSEGQSGMAGSESSKSAGQSKRPVGAKPETDAASSTAAGAGVSQSALEFLMSQAGGPSAGGQGNGAQASAGQPVGGAMASGATGSGQSQAGADADAGSNRQQTAQQASAGISMPSAGAKKPETEEEKKIAEASEQPSEATAAPESDSDEPPPPPGTIAIAKLEALEKGQQAESQTQTAESRSQTNSSQQQDQPPPPPGTIAIPELKKLQGLDEAPLAVKSP